MTIRKQYQNPPIKEVICAFKFNKSSQWDPTIPGIIFAKIKEEFPIREKGQHIETELIFGNEESVQPKVKLSERAVLKSPNHPIMVQISEHNLILNHITPYTSWENFLKYIDMVLNAYVESAEPINLDRIELRYINEFPYTLFENNQLALENYFDFYPHTGVQFDDVVFDSFVTGIQFPFEKNSTQRIEMTSTQNGFIFDLQCIINNPEVGISFRDSLPWLDVAHNQIQKYFEGSIKDSLRAKMKEVHNE